MPCEGDHTLKVPLFLGLSSSTPALRVPSHHISAVTQGPLPSPAKLQALGSRDANTLAHSPGLCWGEAVIRA